MRKWRLVWACLRRFPLMPGPLSRPQRACPLRLPDPEKEVSSEVRALEKVSPQPVSLSVVLSGVALALCSLVFGCFVFAMLVPVGGGPFIVLAPIINLIVGIGIVAAISLRGWSPAKCRIVFYGFTAPTWVFLASLMLWLLSAHRCPALPTTNDRHGQMGRREQDRTTPSPT